MGDEDGYVVRATDCLASIAEARGFFWETLWNHPRNAELKEARGDPNILMEGDRVFVPSLDPGNESIEVDRTHTFRRRGVPEILRLQFLDEDGGPRAHTAYRFEVGKEVREGQLDGEGYLEEWIPPGAKEAQVHLDPDANTPPSHPEVYELDVGRLEPVHTANGAAARMMALGFYRAGRDFARALEEFQAANDLDVTATLDDPTCDQLVELYGS